MPVEPNIEQLRRAAFLADSATAELTAMLPFTEARQARAGDVLLRQGEPAAHVFVLLDGAVKLVRTNGRPREKVVDALLPVATFGETAMLTRHGCPFTAVALEDSSLLAIRAEPLLELMRGRPVLLWRLLEHLSQREAHLLEQLERFGYYNAAQKLAAYLLDHYDCDHPVEPLLGLPPRRTDIASLLSITPETLSREIGKFKRRGWIAVRKGRISIRRPERLNALL